MTVRCKWIDAVCIVIAAFVVANPTWTQAGDVLHQFDRQTSIGGLIWHPDGRHIVAGRGRTFYVFNVNGETTAGPIEADTSKGLYEISLAPDGKYFATGGADGKIRTWNLDGSSRGLVINAFKDDVNGIAFSNNGDYIIAGGKDSDSDCPDGSVSLRVWQKDGGFLHTLPPVNKCTTYQVEANPRYDEIASGMARTVYFQTIEPETPPPHNVTMLEGHSGFITSLRFHPTLDILAVSDVRGNIHLWRRNGTLMAKFNAEVTKFDGPSLAFHQTKNIIISGHHDGKIRFWDFTGKQVTEPVAIHSGGYFIGGVDLIELSPDGKNMVSSSKDGKIVVTSLSNILLE